MSKRRRRRSGKQKSGSWKFNYYHTRKQKVQRALELDMPDECIDCLYARWDVGVCAKRGPCSHMKRWEREGKEWWQK